MVLIHDKNYSARGYVAPTVYLRAGKFVGNWNYYATLAQAGQKWLYVNNKGGSNVAPIGYGSFVGDGSAQTFGINVDFYTLVNGSWVPIGYDVLRTKSPFPPIIYRMYTPAGDGPFYGVFDPRYFSISATIIDNISADRLAALDDFYREVNLLKYRYNSLIAFLNALSKRPLSGLEQQIFNEGILLATNLSNQIRSIQGIEIIYSKDGKIGVPVFLLIAIIVILAAATAWTISSIVTEKEKTKRINDSYELNKWVAQKKIDVAQLESSGQISSAQAGSIVKSLDESQKVANQVAKSAQDQKSLFGEVGDIVKWGVLGYLAFLFVNSKNKPS